MKNLKTLLTAFMLLLLFSFSQCKKHKGEPQLPPETIIGAMTFGCKVNGKVFVPKDGRGRPGLYCQYVNLGAGPGGGYLNIPATNWIPNPPEGVNIGTDSLLIAEGATYQFVKKKYGVASAFYQNGNLYNTTDNNSGQLKINKFDIVNRIISGTFFFTGTDNSNGQTVSITDGRFDIRY